MNQIKTNILPKRHLFAKTKNEKAVDYKAICVFVATGFFMDDDSYWINEKCLLPGHKHSLDADGLLVKSEPWFPWHYTPRDITFEQALEEYIALLTTITKEQVGDNPVILPLSGGIDSRSQALVLKGLKNPVHSFSYSFPGGYPEHKISAKIAKTCGFAFKAFQIPKSYLWNSIDDLAKLNGCYSEFTHPRQMGVLDELKQMEGVFSLGHWGDVLFDIGAPEDTKEEEVIPLLQKKMLKPGGLEFAESLWKAWDLEGDFKPYFISRIERSLSKIKIDNISARVRAFKTSQWAHRWTTTNLCVFEAAHPISMPYYDQRMLEFICTIPEAYLADRRLQIAHLKQDKALANITWHEQKPFHLNNYQYNKAPYNLPYRVFHKIKREVNSLLGNPYIQRNFELQLLGAENDAQLQKYLFDPSFLEFVPKAVVSDFYNKFKNVNTVYYSPPTCMLLTLSLWHKHFYNT
ncbi:asparagine synthetase B family protein [Lacinutrix sp. WUR7]|uniref:asparagine synthase-related protein n=1 Tax=Lacinutrix sp. WUR7 TaxID=2653681 RepID=UPI00193D1F8A|nr:asparagine synthase C-terminal domain-containing protein [Lacinutrix sp. WUR7]QRM87787.1 asparagine synthetase B family protein [Lacinutrix sp. WUR7]